MKIAIGSDHAGFKFKKDLKVYIQKAGHTVADVGCYDDRISCDYPDYAEAVTDMIFRRRVDLGILICGTGIGMSMAANKVPGIRAALIYDDYAARMAKKHNNANVLCFPANLGVNEQVCSILSTYFDIFMCEEYEGGRHDTRLNKIDKLSQSLRYHPRLV
jgi:ribose 5-phosphate isomerase B